MAILIVVGGFSYRSILVSAESSKWVEHTRDTLKNIQMMRLSMETLSSGLRGYIISGREAYLDNYKVGQTGLEPLQWTVLDMTADNPAQQARVAALEG